MNQYKLAIYAPHPVQYHVPIYREVQKINEIKSVVLYADTLGVKAIYQPEFKVAIRWDVPLLDGYDYLFFRNFSKNKMGGFLSRINPGLFLHILTKRYDSVLIQGYHTINSWLILVASKLSNTKIIFRGEAIPKKKRKGWRSNISTKLAKKFLKSCDVVMYSCSGNLEYWQKLDVPERKFFFIPCAVDNDYFQNNYQKLIPLEEGIRKDLGIASDDFVILFSARFTKRKRPLDLIEAVTKVSSQKVVVLFVGNGPEIEAMKKIASERKIRAIFTGFVNQKDISKYYTVADMFAVISSYDASPKALNEALNFSLPVLCSDGVGTAKDLVKEGVNGSVVPYGDINSMANFIKFLSSNERVLREMGANSKRIVKDWTPEKDALGILEALDYMFKRR
jgi:glycosyltransferase involved in cell wall biosynthesis